MSKKKTVGLAATPTLSAIVAVAGVFCVFEGLYIALASVFLYMGMLRTAIIGAVLFWTLGSVVTKSNKGLE